MANKGAKLVLIAALSFTSVNLQGCYLKDKAIELKDLVVGHFEVKGGEKCKPAYPEVIDHPTKECRTCKSKEDTEYDCCCCSFKIPYTPYGPQKICKTNSTATGTEAFTIIRTAGQDASEAASELASEDASEGSLWLMFGVGTTAAAMLAFTLASRRRRTVEFPELLG